MLEMEMIVARRELEEAVLVHRVAIAVGIHVGNRIADEDVGVADVRRRHREAKDRKSTRLNSSHSQISYAVFCLKKKKKKQQKISKRKTKSTTTDFLLTCLLSLFLFFLVSCFFF